mmetsp:Transcript_10836/g.16145  ORF Transcript_10836/g.16145 Transcript_10836/m.16145 type:complete len:219 (-) Transcript_10836:767-1423(-)
MSDSENLLESGKFLMLFCLTESSLRFCICEMHPIFSRRLLSRESIRKEESRPTIVSGMFLILFFERSRLCTPVAFRTSSGIVVKALSFSFSVFEDVPCIISLLNSCFLFFSKNFASISVVIRVLRYFFTVWMSAVTRLRLNDRRGFPEILRIFNGSIRPISPGIDERLLLETSNNFNCRSFPTLGSSFEMRLDETLSSVRLAQTSSMPWIPTIRLLFI